MKLSSKLVIVAKGACMGIADVIPGVSGGTLALILGVYQQFVEGLRSITPFALLRALLAWVTSGFKAEKRHEVIDVVRAWHLGFLIPLGVGIVGAVAVGSAIIPGLMERYPEIMRGLFFGLILASITIPFKLIPRSNNTMLAVAAACAVAFGAFGFAVTNPNTLVDTTSEWVTVTVPAEGDPLSLKDVTRLGPSAITAEQVFWSERNSDLREAITLSDPASAKTLLTLHKNSGDVVVTDKKSLKARAMPYNDLAVPPGTEVHVPRPSYLFVFLAACVAICAMVLPGISGSFILLVLGCYYFILNALKGSISQLVQLEFPVQSLTYVSLFILGIAVGILSFARVMAFLLKRFPAPTMGALVGLMIGCLRGIWPFQQTIEGKITNVVPAVWGTQEIAATVAVVVGIIAVVVLTKVGDRLDEGQASTAEP